jgi:hypothetical protein
MQTRPQTKRLAVVMLALGVLLLSSGTASADDNTTHPNTPSTQPNLPAPNPLDTLRAQIEATRAADPTAFEAVDAVRASVPGIDSRRRGHHATITPSLKTLGTRALHPMLALILDPAARQDADWNDRQKLTLVVGLIEAVGMLRDPAALSALTPLLAPQASTQDAAITQAAAEAIGRIGTDDAANLLAKHLDALSASPTADLTYLHALLAGTGDCRRIATAEALARVAQTTPNLDTALVLARALRDIGNAQAWKTPAVAASGEAASVQRIAVDALNALSLRFDDPLLRERISTALRVVSPSP